MLIKGHKRSPKEIYQEHAPSARPKDKMITLSLEWAGLPLLTQVDVNGRPNETSLDLSILPLFFTKDNYYITECFVFI